jgi:hypothetical protein
MTRNVCYSHFHAADNIDAARICSPLVARASFFRSQFLQGTFSGYQNNDGFRERHLHLAAVVGVALF